MALYQHDAVSVNVGERLRELRDQGARFDLVVLDPPKFAPTAAQAKNAARAYKDINLLAFKLLSPGGLLASFSCSGGVSRELFQSILAGAALDAGVEAKIVERFGAAFAVLLAAAVLTALLTAFYMTRLMLYTFHGPNRTGDQERAHLSAEISQFWQQYSHQPRVKWINSRTREYKYAAYMEAWRAKVERIGNLKYDADNREGVLRLIARAERAKTRV